ncbi:MAG TPA: hypothetical protein ENH05_06475 [Rhizobiales bacterium]|nr:hypothetical protein [Hyphomicrobiales bacterium]
MPGAGSTGAWGHGVDPGRRHNFLLLLSTNVITKGAWAASLFLLLHHFGPRDFGVLAALWALGGLVAGFADLGVGQVLLRNGARTPGLARAIAGQALKLQIGLSLLLFGILVVGAHAFLPTPGLVGDAKWSVIIFSIAATLFDRMSALFTVFSQLAGSYHSFSLYRSGYFVALLATFLAIIRANAGLEIIALGYFLLTLLFLLPTGFETWKRLPASTAIPVPSLPGLIRQGVWFLGGTGLTIAYGRVEVLLLGFFAFTAFAGVYHIAYQLVLLVFSVSGIFFTIIYPRLYRHQRDAAALRTDYLDTVRWLSLLAWAAVLPLMLYAEPILQLIGGTPLRKYADLLRVLSGLILLLPGAAALNFLLPLDLVKQRVMSDLLGLGTTFIIVCGVLVAHIPSAVSAAAVAGYTVAVAAAFFYAASARILNPLVMLRELFIIGWRGGVALAITAWLTLNWWQGSLLYLLLFTALLVATGQPSIRKLLYGRTTAIFH